MNPTVLNFAKSVLIVLSIGPLLGCAPMKINRDDPLIGKIIASEDQREISYKNWLAKAILADVIYLGENHENADHHQIQFDIINDLIKAGKKPQLGFEFFSVEQTSHLMAYANQKSRGMHGTVSAETQEKRLRENLGWQNRSDRNWQFYFRLIKLAKTHQLMVFGADLSAGTVSRISRGGVDGLTPVEKNLLQPTGFEYAAYKKLMFEKFKANHCGYARKDHQERMYQTWIARNDTMARSIAAMSKIRPQEPVVMILGGGHVEYDMAVFERVQALTPELVQMNLGLKEIYIEPATLNSYLETTEIDGISFKPAHQFFWFTQRFTYEDPCKRFRKVLEKMGK